MEKWPRSQIHSHLEILLVYTFIEVIHYLYVQIFHLNSYSNNTFEWLRFTHPQNHRMIVDETCFGYIPEWPLKVAK